MSTTNVLMVCPRKSCGNGAVDRLYPGLPLYRCIDGHTYRIEVQYLEDAVISITSVDVTNESTQ